MLVLGRDRRRSLLVALVFAVGLISIAPSSALAAYSYVTKWGSGGPGDGQFRSPRGIAVDTTGDVYVTDPGNGLSLGANDRVEKFDSNGVFLAKWGSLGSGDLEFHDPWGIAVDAGNKVFVADLANAYVKKFNSVGVFDLKFGGPGNGDGQFGFALGVAVDSAGNVYVTDHDGSPPTVDRVQKFKPVLGGYAYDDQWGVTGTEPGKFDQPYDVAIDAAADVYVSDNRNNRIQKFDSSGNFITAWGSMGSGDGQFVYQEGLGVDAAGNVYVADRGNNRVEKFSSSGAFLTKWGSTGSGDGQFLQPSDVAVDSACNVYVVDSGNDRIQKFADAGATCGAVGNSFTIESTSSSSKSGKIKFKLKLPAPGIVDAVATVIPPPRPPPLDPGQRKTQTGRNRVFAKKKKAVTAAKAHVTVAKAGLLTLTLAPNRVTKKYLTWKSPLKTKVRIAYTPTGGTSRTVAASAKFKLTRKKRR